LQDLPNSCLSISLHRLISRQGPGPPVACRLGRSRPRPSGRPCKPRHFAGYPGEHRALPGAALPRPKLRTPEHQDCSPDHRPPGRRGRDPGGFAQAEALQKEGHAPHPQAQPCSECADGRRAGAHDSKAGVGHKRLSTTEIYATVAPALVKEAYDLHGFGPVSAGI